MILKAFDNDCGVISVNSLEDIYKVAAFGVDDTIKNYNIERENDLITVTYATVNGKKFKFAIYEDEFDLGLSTKPSSYIYLGGHTKIDTVFSEGQSYPIVRTKEDGTVVLKAENGKGYNIPQKFIDIYFEPSSEQSRYEQILNERGTQNLDTKPIDEGLDTFPDQEDMMY